MRCRIVGKERKGKRDIDNNSTSFGLKKIYEIVFKCVEGSYSDIHLKYSLLSFDLKKCYIENSFKH